MCHPPHAPPYPYTTLFRSLRIPTPSLADCAPFLSDNKSPVVSFSTLNLNSVAFIFSLTSAVELPEWCLAFVRSEERRVGKEGRSRGEPCPCKQKTEDRGQE